MRRRDRIFIRPPRVWASFQKFRGEDVYIDPEPYCTASEDRKIRVISRGDEVAAMRSMISIKDPHAVVAHFCLPVHPYLTMYSTL